MPCWSGAELAPPLISPLQIRDTLAANVAEGRVGGLPVAAWTPRRRRPAPYARLVGRRGWPRLHPSEAQIRARSLAAHMCSTRPIANRPQPVNTARASHPLDGIKSRKWRSTAVRPVASMPCSLTSNLLSSPHRLAITFGVMGRQSNGPWRSFNHDRRLHRLRRAERWVTRLHAVHRPSRSNCRQPPRWRGVEGWCIRLALNNRPAGDAAGDLRHLDRAEQNRGPIIRSPGQPGAGGGWIGLATRGLISSIRIAIFLLGVGSSWRWWLVLNRTRLGLEVRAVTQNPR